MKKHVLVILLTLLMQAAYPPSAQACFGLGRGQPYTFRLQAAESKVILFGHPENAQKPKTELDAGTTDFVITTVLRDDPLLTNKQKIQLPFYVPNYIPNADPGKPQTYLIFGILEMGKLNFFNGFHCTPAAADYLKDLIAIDAKDRVKQMRYCFDYLDHADPEIAKDALIELMPKFFTTPPRKEPSAETELTQVARTLPPEKLRQWLQDEKTPQYRLDIYAFILGHCGTEKDAALLRTLIEKSAKQESADQLSGLLAGYILLQPKDGWEYACSLSRAKVRWMVHYSVFRMTRFFYTSRPDVISQKRIVALYSDLMDQKDIADFLIEQLRRWKNWTLTDRILTIGKQKPLPPLLRNSIVRYALQCPDPQAAAFVAALRKADPQYVADEEQSLQWDAVIVEAGKANP